MEIKKRLLNLDDVELTWDEKQRAKNGCVLLILVFSFEAFLVVGGFNENCFSFKPLLYGNGIVALIVSCVVILCNLGDFAIFVFKVYKAIKMKMKGAKQ